MNHSEALPIHVKIVVALDVLPVALTIIGNSMFLVTLLKSRSLHTPSNFLLGMLCCSDLLVGVVVQPLFLINTQSTGQCYPFDITSSIYYYCYVICCGCSLFLASLLSIDRYIAICHPFKYYTIVNIKNYGWIIGVLFLTWTAISATIFLSMYYLWMGFMIIEILVIVVILISYARIYSVLSKVKRTVQNIGVIEGVAASSLQKQKRERDKTCTIAVILGFLLVSYSVELGRSLAFLLKRKENCDEFHLTLIIDIWTDLFVLANSFVNPIVYGVRSNEIRKAALKIFRPQRRSITPAGPEKSATIANIYKESHPVNASETSPVRTTCNN